MTQFRQFDRTSPTGELCSQHTRPHRPARVDRADSAFSSNEFDCVAGSQSSIGSKIRSHSRRMLVITALLLCCGCHHFTQRPVALPNRHKIRSDQLLVLSNFKLSSDHPLIVDLNKLRQQVAHSLELPLQKNPVVIYLFENQLEYRQYLHATYPGLPPRRAYFVGTPHELAVYTFWGERIQEDLRHEYTHGLLHAGLKNVPLWLDEGLAEYFEVSGPKPGRINEEHAQRLSQSLKNGWQPDLTRLERLEEFSQMQRVDYQEAWAWVHYMMHTSPEAKRSLLSYLDDLRSDPDPVRLSARLQDDHSDFESQFLDYLASITKSGERVSSL